MQLTYHSHKRSSNFRGSSSLELIQLTSTRNQSHITLNVSILLLLIDSLLSIDKRYVFDNSADADYGDASSYLYYYLEQ
jgi:hypothetical protein